MGRNIVRGFISRIVKDRRFYHNRKANSAVMVFALHAALLAMLVCGLRWGLTAPPTEYVMTLGGPVGDRDSPIPPKMVEPEIRTVLPPDIPSDMQDAANTEAVPAGSMNVTRPAEALADAHAFPALPAAFRASPPAPVLLLIFIAESGEVTDVRIRRTSGSPELDAYAIDWVKRFWHYRPAVRNGQTVSETAMAILRFVT